MGTKKGRKHFGKLIIDEVLAMKNEGKTNSEIAKFFNFESKWVIKQLIARYNRNKRNIQENLPPAKRGRPRKTPISNFDELQKENERLKMENELLRSFLKEIERG